MTDDRMALLELVEQRADGDLVRDMLAFAAERIMEAEVEARTGAAKGARTPMREVQRNGYRDRDWDTRAGRVVSRMWWKFPFGTSGQGWYDAAQAASSRTAGSRG